jgi:hypothetical protein
MGGGGDRFYLLRQDFDGTPGDGVIAHNDERVMCLRHRVAERITTRRAQMKK